MLLCILFQDWKTIGIKFDDIVTGIFTNCVKILNIAKEETADVEKAVKPKLDTALKESKKILEKAFDGIKEQTLTVADSQTKAQLLKDLFTRTKDTLKDELTFLHPIANGKIADVCDDVFKLIDQKAAEILKLFNPE